MRDLSSVKSRTTGALITSVHFYPPPGPKSDAFVEDREASPSLLSSDSKVHQGTPSHAKDTHVANILDMSLTESLYYPCRFVVFFSYAPVLCYFTLYALGRLLPSLASSFLHVLGSKGMSQRMLSRRHDFLGQV